MLEAPTALFCDRHEVSFPAAEQYCPHCILEGLTKRFQPTARQIIEGVVAPSWERAQL